MRRTDAARYLAVAGVQQEGCPIDVLRLYLLEEELARRLEDGKRALMDGWPVRDPGRASASG